MYCIVTSVSIMVIINSTNNFTLSDWNHSLAVVLIPNDVILILYLILGFGGNMLVILVYGLRMTKKSEERYFIPVLAISDLSGSVICASFAIGLNMFQAKFTNTSICKAWWFFAAFTTYLSMLLLAIIAVHRYLKVCRPFGKQMSVVYKRLSIMLAICLALILGAPTVMLYGSVDFPNTEKTLVGRRCSKLKNVSKIGSLIYSSIAGLVTLVTITMLIGFYGKIGCTIYRHFQHMSKDGSEKKTSEKNAHFTVTSESRSHDTKETISFDVTSSRSDVTSSRTDVTSSRTYNNEPPTLEKCSDIIDNSNTKYSEQDSSDAIQFENVDIVDSKNGPGKSKTRIKKKPTKNEDFNRKVMYKFTLMFMMITIVFLVCYIPKVFLIVMEARNPKFWENFSDHQRAVVLFFYRGYIINNIVNPFIYAFMDLKFRHEAWSLLRCSKTE